MYFVYKKPPKIFIYRYIYLTCLYLPASSLRTKGLQLSIPNLAMPKRASVPHAAALVSKRRVHGKSPPEKGNSKEAGKKNKVNPQDEKKVLKQTLKDSKNDKIKKSSETETKSRPSALKKPSTSSSATVAAKTLAEVKNKLEQRRVEEQREKEEEMESSGSESDISMGKELEAILGKSQAGVSEKGESSSEAEPDEDDDGKDEDENADGVTESESEETQESEPSEEEDEASVKESKTKKGIKTAPCSSLVPAEPVEPAAGTMVRNSSSAYIDQVFFPDSKPYIPYYISPTPNPIDT